MKDSGFTGDALCAELIRDGDVDWWFPNGGPLRQATMIDEARRLCHKCPVFQECSNYYLNSDFTPSTGIWAGMTVRELKRGRARLERSRKVVA
jgi:hypothetical protein